MENNIQIAAPNSFLNRKSFQLLSVILMTGLLALTSVITARTSSATTAASATAAAVIAPQSAISGEWTAELSKKSSDRIQFNLNRQADGGHSNFGEDFALSDFQGLTREQMMGASTNVRFRLVREAEPEFYR
jgi:hypothetical protein